MTQFWINMCMQRCQAQRPWVRFFRTQRIARHIHSELCVFTISYVIHNAFPESCAIEKLWCDVGIRFYRSIIISRSGSRHSNCLNSLRNCGNLWQTLLWSRQFEHTCCLLPTMSKATNQNMTVGNYTTVWTICFIDNANNWKCPA